MGRFIYTFHKILSNFNVSAEYGVLSIKVACYHSTQTVSANGASDERPTLPAIPLSLSQVNLPRTMRHVPLHMLNWQNSGRSQARWISSSARYATDDKGSAAENGDTSKPEDQPRTGLVSFGFQSLAGLFQPAARPYQRPGFDTRGTQDLKARPVPVHERGASIHASKPEKLLELSTGPVTQATTEAGSGPEPATAETSSQSTRETIRSARVRKHASVKGMSESAENAKSRVASRRLKLEARQSHAKATGFSHLARRVLISPQVPRRPQFARAPAFETNGREVNHLFHEAGGDSAATSDGAVEFVPSTPNQPEAEDSTSRRPYGRLTHVKSTGEAHMVDVGAKLDTRRSAIAISTVTFTNPQAFQLIFENSNKKGDVLGVARIAGIMAAKRTSDLIPLCHPISISKAELELKLIAPNVESTLYGQNQHGVVTIQAHIETTGPTGVEMEALTAASAAALTIYDMCKAVDRAMAIGRTRVVYKHGGHSGIFAHAPWMRKFGERYLSSRGLKVPDIERWVGR